MFVCCVVAFTAQRSEEECSKSTTTRSQGVGPASSLERSGSEAAGARGEEPRQRRCRVAVAHREVGEGDRLRQLAIGVRFTRVGFSWRERGNGWQVRRKVSPSALVEYTFIHPLTLSSKKGIFSYTPEPQIAFCIHFFPCLNPIFKNGSFLSAVALCVCDTLRFESPPLPGKKIDFGTDSLLFPLRTATIDLPECQERRGAKTIKSVFFEKASPAECRRRLHMNTAYAHL